MVSRDLLDKITQLEAEISKIENRNKSLYAMKQKELNNLGLISTCHGIYLYQDRIIGDGRTIMLDSNVQAAVESNGQISYTTEVKGGGSRPTLTRIAAGGLIAGPLGAVIGATAQKKKKTKTITHEHDDRTVTLSIASDDGFITRTWAGDATEGRNFTTAIMNAVTDYSKNKKGIELRRKQLVKEMKELKEDNELTQKKKELRKLMDEVPEDDRKEIGKLNDKLKTSFISSIVGLLFCLFPIFGVIAPIVALVNIVGPRKLGVKDGKAKATFVMAIIGLIISSLMTIAFITTYKPEEYSTNAEDVTSQETNSNSVTNNETNSNSVTNNEKNYIGSDAKVAYSELIASGYAVKFVFDRPNNAGFTEEQLQQTMLSDFESASYDEMPYVITKQSILYNTATLYVEYKSVVETNEAQATREENLSRVLSIESAMSACELYGQQNYSGFKMHSIVGKIAEYASDDSTWFLKYYVDADGYTNKAMECYVSGTTSSPVVTRYLVY